MGAVSKSPHITTNEGPPDKNVRIMADVVARPDSTFPIVIKPYKLDLTQFGEKVRSEIKFTIQNVSDKPLQTTIISAPNELMDVKLPKSIPAGKTGEGVVTLKKTAFDKAFEKCVTIQLNDEKSTRFSIPIKRTVRTAATAATTPTAGTVQPASH
jgi:hypothetical protein